MSGEIGSEKFMLATRSDNNYEYLCPLNIICFPSNQFSSCGNMVIVKEDGISKLSDQKTTFLLQANTLNKGMNPSLLSSSNNR